MSLSIQNNVAMPQNPMAFKGKEKIIVNMQENKDVIMDAFARAIEENKNVELEIHQKMDVPYFLMQVRDDIIKNIRNNDKKSANALIEFCNWINKQLPDSLKFSPKFLAEDTLKQDAERLKINTSV